MTDKKDLLIHDHDLYIEKSRKVYEKITDMPATQARKNWAEYIYHLVHGKTYAEKVEEDRVALIEAENARKSAENARKKAENAQVQTAINFLKMGITVEAVAQATCFSIERVEELKKQ